MVDESLLSLVYTSTATEPFDEARLRELLDHSRDANAAVDVTGMLLYRRDRFIQFLEGPEPVVRRLVDRISADRRHRRVRVLLEDPIDHRQFPGWTMGYEAASDDEMPIGYRNSFDDLYEGDDRGVMIQAARELTMWFRRRSDPQEH